MKKLSLDALKARNGEVASENLLLSISGGTENSCHDGSNTGGGMTIPELRKRLEELFGPQ